MVILSEVSKVQVLFYKQNTFEKRAQTRREAPTCCKAYGEGIVEGVGKPTQT